MLEIIETLRDAFEAYVQVDAAGEPDESYFQAGIAAHRAIARALHARDAVRASEAMKHHLEDNLEHFRVSIAMAESAGAQAS